MYLSISLTNYPRGVDVYMLQFCLVYYLDLIQIGEKQTKAQIA